MNNTFAELVANYIYPLVEVRTPAKKRQSLKRLIAYNIREALYGSNPSTIVDTAVLLWVKYCTDGYEFRNFINTLLIFSEYYNPQQALYSAFLRINKFKRKSDAYEFDILYIRDFKHD